MTMFLKFWKEGLLVLLAVALFAMWRSRENGLVEKGKAQERARVADSTLAVVTPQRLKAETLLVRDTLRVRQTIERVRTTRDTVLMRLTDTAYVRVYVERTDSALAACSDLLGNCAAFRVSANQTIAALQIKLAAQPVAQPRSCMVPTTVGGVLGAVVGFAAGRR